MPLVFYSENQGAAGRSTMYLSPGEINTYREKMHYLEQELRNVQPGPGSRMPVKEVSLSGSFPKDEILSMLLQNPACTHISFLTGWDEIKGHYTLMVPMKDVIPGDIHSGTIIDNESTLYSAVCCQHPPFINA